MKNKIEEKIIELKSSNKKQIMKGILNILLYVLFLIVMIIVICHKENLEGDEVYSYGLSNNKGGIGINFEEGKTYEPTSIPFMNYVTVGENERFNYINVWLNQREDVHPPVYYFIFHTICSLFPGTFSIWFAGIINIVFALLTLYFLRKLVKNLIKNEVICFLISFCFILSSGILSAISFFRMYVLTMFLMVLLSYLFVNQIGEQNTRKFYVLVAITSIVGALTHYYCIFFIISSCMIYGVYLLLTKKKKDLKKFCCVMFGAGVTAILMFPPMIKHMFFSYRGKENVENLKQMSVESFIERFERFYTIINVNVFGKSLKNITIIIVFLFILLIIKKIIKKQSLSELAKNTIFKYTILVIPTLCYFFAVTILAPFLQSRYMISIYAVLLLTVISILSYLLLKLINKKIVYIFLAIVVLLLVYYNYQNANWHFLHRDSLEFLEQNPHYTELDCLYVYEFRWRINLSFYEVLNYKSVTFKKSTELENILVEKYDSKDELIIIIADSDQTKIDKILEKYPNLTNYKVINRYNYSSYCTTYYAYNASKIKL